MRHTGQIVAGRALAGAADLAITAFQGPPHLAGIDEHRRAVAGRTEIRIIGVARHLPTIARRVHRQFAADQQVVDLVNRTAEQLAVAHMQLARQRHRAVGAAGRLATHPAVVGKPSDGDTAAVVVAEGLHRVEAVAEIAPAGTTDVQPPLLVQPPRIPADRLEAAVLGADVHDRADGHVRTVQRECVRALVGAAFGIAAIGHHRADIGPGVVGQVGGVVAEGHDRRDPVRIGLVDIGLAMRGEREPSAFVGIADAGLARCRHLVGGQVGGQDHQRAAETGLDLGVAEVTAEVRALAPHDDGFGPRGQTVGADAGGLAFLDRVRLARHFEMPGQVEADRGRVIARAGAAFGVDGDGGAGERAAGDAPAGVQLALRLEDDRQVGPVHEVAAGGVPPMHVVPAPAVGVELVVQVVPALEAAQAVRVVHPMLRRLEVHGGADWIGALRGAVACRGLAACGVEHTDAAVKQIISTGQIHIGHGGIDDFQRVPLLRVEVDLEALTVQVGVHDAFGDACATRMQTDGGSMALLRALDEQVELGVTVGRESAGIGRLRRCVHVWVLSLMGDGVDRRMRCAPFNGNRLPFWYQYTLATRRHEGIYDDIYDVFERL